MNVLLGMPAGSIVKTATMVAVVQALFSAPCPITFVVKEGALGPDNRAQLAYLALHGGDFTHLWLVDADMEFPPDTLARLLAHDVDLVGAAYNYRISYPHIKTFDFIHIMKCRTRDHHSGYCYGLQDRARSHARSPK